MKHNLLEAGEMKRWRSALDNDESRYDVLKEIVGDDNLAFTICRLVAAESARHRAFNRIARWIWFGTGVFAALVLAVAVKQFS